MFNLFTRRLSTTPYENILVETRGKVGLITLNRPRALNALCSPLFSELNHALLSLDNNSSIGAIVLTGSKKSFAAGADIKEMSSKSYMDNYKSNFITQWTLINNIRKPIIAAVNGIALGGGCELAMMCDIIYAGAEAKFGQPEIKLGGSQRLIHAIGKSKAMEMVLTGKTMNAVDAERSGLVARVFPVDELVDEAVKTAALISGYSLPIVMMCKEAVNKSQELSLTEGLHFERRLFHSTFATKDQKEGMAAFLEKRSPVFQDE